MSSFKMGFKNIFVFAALLLICKTCMVHGQGARVEYINQPYCSPTATNAPQLVVPAIIKPVISPYDSYIQESAPIVPAFNGFNNFNGYSSFSPSYPTPMPPIIIDDGDDDNWHHLLYFLIFAMRNRRGGYGNYGGNYGGYNGNCGCGGGCNGGCGGGYNGGYNGGCGCGGNCGGSCGGCDNIGFSGFGNCGSGLSYIPYPIPVPMNGPYPYSFPGFGYPENSCGCQEEIYQPTPGNNEINVIIRAATDPCNC